MNLSPGARHYLVTALWSTCGYEDQADPLDKHFSIEDISDEFKLQAQSDFDKFYAMAQNLFEEDELDFETIGHDFWLTRNRHGAGFWDGDYKNGEAITELVHKHFPENDDELREAVA
jgi:hypothetical protein